MASDGAHVGIFRLDRLHRAARLSHLRQQPVKEDGEMGDEEASSTQGRHLLITVHGIRTFGLWQERLGEMLKETEPDAIAVDYKFGYFSGIAFLIPMVRDLLVRRFARALRARYKQGTWKRIDIVAHSFGTYIAANALLRMKPEERPPVHTMILAGSVLKVSFPLERFLGICVKRLVNECGIRDFVLILGQGAAVGTGLAGRSGIVGLQDDKFQNRFHQFGHSGYFDDDGTFMRTWWLPLLLGDGSIPRHPYPRALSNVKGALLFLINNADALKLTIVLAVCVGGLVLYQEARKANEIVGGFYQGDRKQEYAALWSLSAARSDRVRKAVVVGLLKDVVGARQLADDRREVVTAFGLRTAPFTALKGVAVSGRCRELSRDYFVACLTVARIAGDDEVFAQHILDLLPSFKWRSGDDDRGQDHIIPYSEELGGALLEAARTLKGNQQALAARVADVVEQIGQDDILATELLLQALGELLPQLQEVDREKLANRIAQQLPKANFRYALALADTLKPIVPTLKGNQLELAVNRFVELVETTESSIYFPLHLASSLSQEQARRVNGAIVARLAAIADQGSGLPDSATLVKEANLCWAEAVVATEGKLSEEELAQGAEGALELLKRSIPQTGSQSLLSSGKGAPRNPSFPPSWRPLTRAIETWAGGLTGASAETFAQQLADLIPQVPGLAGALSIVTSRLVGDQTALGSRIVSVVPQVRGTARENPALALIPPAARRQLKSNAEVGVQALLQQVKAHPDRVANTVSTAAVYLSDIQSQQLTDEIAELIGKSTVDTVGELGEILLELLDRVRDKVRYAKSACDRILALVSQGRGGQAESFGRLLAKLGGYLPHQDIEDIATKIVNDLSKASASQHPMSDPAQEPTEDRGIHYYPASINLSSALSALAGGIALNGGQACVAADRILTLLEEAVRDKMEAARAAKGVSEYPHWDTETVPTLAGQVGALASHMSVDEQSALAGRILGLVSLEVASAGLVKPLAENSRLMAVLVTLTPRLTGDQSALVDRVETLRDKSSEPLTTQLSDALLGLAANADAPMRKRVLMAVIGQSKSVSCEVAIANAQSSELSLLIDMLKWPICPGFPSGIILKIVDLRHTDRSGFSNLSQSSDSGTFTTNPSAFFEWLARQKDDAGNSFDLSGPPMFTPVSAAQSVSRSSTR
jgi:hypothetical protein